jgi:diadenosine tetraphosphate (Ap4A) HIT family hydrolase
MTFILHPNLARKDFILDLPLSRVLLEDNCYYPWVFLVPRRENVSRLIDLSIEDQYQLLIELDLAQRVLWELFIPVQLNVAAIGNKTPQLHVHVIARQSQDPAWPGTVWDHGDRLPYSPEEKEAILHKLETAFKNHFLRDTPS